MSVLLCCLFIFSLLSLGHTGFPKKCPKNEEWKREGLGCQQCNNYAVVSCAPAKISACYCIDGYIRDQDDEFKCVLIKDCTKDYFNYYDTNNELMSKSKNFKEFKAMTNGGGAGHHSSLWNLVMK